MGAPSSEFRAPHGVRPATIEEAATAIRDLAAEGRTLRLRGGGTKLDWLAPHGSALPPTSRWVVESSNRPVVEKSGSVAESGELLVGDGSELGTRGPADLDRTVELDARGLDRVLEHNEGDFTAVLEAGVRLADAQATFARAGQMLALDPPLGVGDAATIGGVIATADSGPLRHRYGGVRELVLGATVVLSDGTVAKSGGKVIKNVAGYDLAKLFAGSYGTLGMIARVAVRLHPLGTTAATAVGSSADPDRLAATARAFARLPLEADSLDVAWSHGAGRVLVRFSGAAAVERAHAAAARMERLEAVETVTDDDALWARQRAMQRATSSSDNGVGPRSIVLKVSGRPTDLAAVLRAAEAAGGSVVSRAALGLSWIALPAVDDVDAVRKALSPRACTVLDGADRVRDPWPAIGPGALAVMKRVKARFDPAGAFLPGGFVGGI